MDYPSVMVGANIVAVKVRRGDSSRRGEWRLTIDVEAAVVAVPLDPG